MTEDQVPWKPAPPSPWWQDPHPWTCDRCGRVFDISDWEDHLSKWMRVDIEQLAPYGPPLCHRCLGVRRLQAVLFAMPEVEVEPCEPGVAIYAATDDGMSIVVEPDGTIRERDGFE